MNFKEHIVSAFVLYFFGFFTFAQDGFTQQSFTDLNSFKAQAGNWFLVGDVVMNPLVAVTHKESLPLKKKEKRKKQEATELPKAVQFTEGSGILLNVNNENSKDALITQWEHGDMELELDVMLPKGSNSGIYLQGRYEIQLFDSYGVKSPKYSDMGGIYRNWEKEQGKVYLGKAPLSNAAKAPGLWQHLTINFRAPRFDSDGNKVANAKIVQATLNGITIHQNVEIPLPTGGAIENNEKAVGPIMIQGDHGPVAIKNFKYKLLKESTVALTPFSYEAYQGDFKTDTDVLNAQPVSSGTLNELTFKVSATKNNFGVRYESMVTIAESGSYTFKVSCNGSASLKVNNVVLSDDDWSVATGTLTLEEGIYPLEIVYYKTVGWLEPKLGLEIKSENTLSKSFHHITSYPPDGDFVAPIYVNVGASPKHLRAFLDYEKDRDQRLTHTIAVGDPSELHYVYNLASGNIACVWKGAFIDATPMWHNRGDGSYQPRGVVTYLSKESAFTTSNGDSFKSLGYTLDEQGIPTFLYNDMGVKVKDKIYPDTSKKHLIREVTFENVPKENSPEFKLAHGQNIQKLTDSLYVVNQSYYIHLENGTRAHIAKNELGELMLVSPSISPITYSIIW
ncbi:family 16 glycoside hydrolase [Arenibacter sp. GZD96]|uniref:family 16 glycoside hydrolase n=1 Tax=Aurantibrevibacter litoralis TaxID=3106030 RepID=UPI002AFF43F4|nr:family 16 glycoside hydrolase [Arenibacter sp. GZD-96]MEA1786185.1 family 16 glycoside hydrolase [Arenibacter sp. GZD-96]